MSPSPNLIARPALEPGLLESGAAPDLTIREASELGLAVLQARRGQEASLGRCVREHFGTDLPAGPRRTNCGAPSFAGLAPGRWLAIEEQAGNALAQRLRGAVSSFATVVDQTDACCVLQLSGLAVRSRLASLVPVDIHPGAFPLEGFALTRLGHCAVMLWRLPDATDGASFVIAAPRSYAASLWHSLTGPAHA